MPSIVRAEPGVGRLDTAVITNDELKKETTVYAGEVVVDGVSQISLVVYYAKKCKWVYIERDSRDYFFSWQKIIVWYIYRNKRIT